MKPLIFLLLFLSLSRATYANDSPLFPISPDESVIVGQKLRAYETDASRLLDKNGYAKTDAMGISDIIDTNDDTIVHQSREIIGYYLLHTNEVSLRAKFLVGWCYGNIGMFSNTVNLVQEYVNVYSNDFRAWNMLGTSYMFMKSSEKAIESYTKAVKLGDRTSYIALAGAAIQGDQWDIVRSIIPQLIGLKQSKRLSQDHELDVVVILLSYSIKVEDKDLFVKALYGVSAKKMLSREDLKQLVTMGCQLFKGKEIDRIRHKLEAAEARDSNSTTNAPSP